MACKRPGVQIPSAPLLEAPSTVWVSVFLSKSRRIVAVVATVIVPGGNAVRGDKISGRVEFMADR
jgi:hypothetical protein